MDDDIIADGLVEEPPPDRPGKKYKNLTGFKPAVHFNKDTGEKEFIPKRGERIYIEFRGSAWRDDTYYVVEHIDHVTGDLHLFNLNKRNNGGSNFKRVEEHDYHIWIPPKGKGPRNVYIPLKKKNK